MNMNLLQVILLGRKYLALWPKRVELQNYFDVYQQVQVSRFVCRYSFYFALFILILPLAFNAHSMFAQSLVSAVFITSMPIQAYIMMGLQADKFLPPALASWYKQGVARINEQGGSIKLSIHKPRYMDLVTLLNLSYQRSNH